MFLLYGEAGRHGLNCYFLTIRLQNSWTEFDIHKIKKDIIALKCVKVFVNSWNVFFFRRAVDGNVR